MSPLQRIQIRLEEKRRELSKLLDMETRGDDFTDKLAAAKKAIEDCQIEVSAAALAEPAVEEVRTETSEGLELRSLHDAANVGAMFDKVLAHAVPVGEIAELQQHYGLEANQIPVQLLSGRHDPELETRAVTPAPSNVGQNQNAILPYVFPDGAAAFLGVDQPVVGVGEQVFPVLTSKLGVHTPAENAASAETTGAFSAEVLAPSRLQAAFEYSREDRARFASMDSALRENLSQGLSDGLDKEILAGTNGLFTGTVLANHAEAAATTFDQFIAKLAFARVDGRYASSTGALTIVMGSDSYADAGSTYRNNSVDRTALDRLMEITGGVRVSAHVPAKSGDKQNAVVRVGSLRHMVAPIWAGVTLIPDEVTKAANGQIVITAVMLHAVKLLRADGYYKQEINLS